ncbi:HEAT repeat domain-containing protein [Micromonospora sp. NPDC049799]|uniref:HEAT repeat domain-containing protein n=1 Tax=Micromonospora sp. NPDC049799 TaxID=3154741 RepID=UPI0033CCA1A7
MWRRQRSWDAVDWSAVQCAYGPAVEVPGLLDRLRSRTRDIRQASYQRLSDVLNGSSEAGAVVAPFLVEIVGDPKAPDRFAAAQVLAAIAVGDQSTWLIERDDPATARREVERRRSLTRADLEREQDEWVVSGPTADARAARARRVQWSDVEEDRDGQRWAVQAYDAVRAGVPAYLSALTSPDVAVRLHVAHLLAWFPEERASIAPVLARLIVEEPDPFVAATACVAAGLCAGGTDDTALVDAVSRRRDAVNRGEEWSAVLGLARLRSAPDRPLVEELYGCLDGARGPVPHWPLLGGDMATVAALTIRDLPAGVAEDRVRVLVDRVTAPADETDRWLLLRAALDAAFPHGPIPDGTRFADLNDDQRYAVTALRQAGELTGGAMVSMLVGSYNLGAAGNPILG